MHLTRLTSAHRQGFRAKTLHKHVEKRLSAVMYLKQKSSFLIAAVSLFAFVAGNMIGSHGVYAFWKSVWGKYDDSLIAYTGTVAPIANVPDYECWGAVGGGEEGEYTFRQVPEQCLMPLPTYDIEKQRQGDPIFEVGYMGSYKDGADGKGSHPGVDIRTPKNTPVLAIANGMVTSVREDKGGFGKLIVIRHPHVPDPRDPTKTTILHSAYAHLDAQLVAEGDIVQKGQVIGLSGSTGFATGNHLHFQIDRDTFADGEEIPWHPYWPFSGAEARQAGLTLAGAIDAGLNQSKGYQTTVSPMLYVQANYKQVPDAVIAHGAAGSLSASSLSPEQMKARLLGMRDARRDKRIARQKELVVAQSAPAPIIVRETVASVQDPPPSAPSIPSSTGTVRTIEIQHDQSFTGRGWETITVTLLDEAGNAVDGSELPRDLHLRTAYGDAEFRPEVLSPLDFHGGQAEVKMLPRGRRTIVITVQPFGILSEPMKYDGK